MIIKNIVFYFENCDSVTIDEKYIGDICLKNFEKKIIKNDKYSIDIQNICNYIFIEIHNSANVQDYVLNLNINNSKNNKYYIFDRLNQYHDVVAFEITFFDDSLPENKTFKEFYVTAYTDINPYIFDSGNINQSSYISNLGHLYLLITPNKTIFDVINIDQINNEDYIKYFGLFHLYNNQ